FVLLVVHREVTVVDLQDLRGGGTRDGQDTLAQGLVDHRCSLRSHSLAMKSAAMLRPSEKSSRRISSCSASSFHGTTSSSSGSSPGRRSGYRSRASTRCAEWLM